VGKILNKIADLEKPVHRKIHHDEFCYWLKPMYLFLLHPVCYFQRNNFCFVISQKLEK
jgi:hypothetical protein